MKAKMFATFCAVVLSTNLAVDAKEAARYKLDEGKGYPVCVEFLNTLNALPANEPPPVCDLKLPADEKRFRHLKWEPVDWRKNLESIHAMERLLAGPNPSGEALLRQTFAEWRDAYLTRVEKEKLEPRLRRTQATLNSRGPETLLAYDRDTRRCERAIANKWAATGGALLFVVSSRVPGEIEKIEGLASDMEQQPLVRAGRTYLIKTFDGGSPWATYVYNIVPPLPATITDSRGEYIMSNICRISLSK